MVDLDTERKVWCGLQARAALAGWQLTRTDPADGPATYFATRWNRPHQMATLAECEAFLDRVAPASRA